MNESKGVGRRICRGIFRREFLLCCEFLVVLLVGGGGGFGFRGLFIMFGEVDEDIWRVWK